MKGDVSELDSHHDVKAAVNSEYQRVGAVMTGQRDTKQKLK